MEVDCRSPIRVLLADDNLEFVRSLRALLNGQRDLEVIGEAYSGPETVAQAMDLCPDVAVLDVRMPGLSGIEAAGAIAASGLHTAVLILSISVDRQYVLAAVKAGAAGYLSKESSGQDLISAIRALAKGGSCFLPLPSCTEAVTDTEIPV